MNRSRDTSTFRSNPFHSFPFKRLFQIVITSYLLFSSQFAMGDRYLSHGESSQSIQDHVSNRELFQRALEYDFRGENKKSRAIYDRLKSSELAGVVAVPSFVNLIALQKYGAATQAVAELTAGDASRDRDYAALWNVWLVSKQWRGSGTELTALLQNQVANYSWQLSWESQIAQVYLGQIPSEKVLDSIVRMNINENVKNDALTESLFFIGSYWLYVKKNKHQAKKFFCEDKYTLSHFSLEYPLIERACRHLK